MQWTDDEVDARLYQRNGVWYARDRRGGADAKRSLQTRSRREARAAAREWLKGRDALHSGEQRITWTKAAEHWAAYVLPDAVKESTSRRYLVSAGQVSAFLRDEARRRRQADLYVDQIDTKLIMDYLRRRKQAGTAARTRKRDLTAWSDIMSCCVAEGWRSDNPVQAIDRKAVRTRREPIRLPPMKEVEALIAYVGPMKGRLVDLLWRTGMRLEEATQLEHDDWSKAGVQLYGDATKTSKARFIPLDDGQDPEWMRAAAGTLAGTPRHLKSTYVFWRPSGDGATCRTTMSNTLSQARKALGFTWRTHDLRHLFAVLYLKSFMPNPRQALYRLQQIMGHASIKQTEEYLQFVGPDVQVEAVIPDEKRDQKRDHA